MELEFKKCDDFWIDNGIENLYHIFRNMGYYPEIKPDKITVQLDDIDNFIKDFASEIEQLKNEKLLIEVKDKKGIKKRVKKDYILIQYGSKDKNGVNTLKEKIYLNPKDELTKIFKLITTKPKNSKSGKVCLCCGGEFSKEYQNMKQASYPMTTKIKSLGGIRGNAENYKEICPKCYLTGILEWTDDYLYKYMGDKAYMFIPYINDLVKLSKFKERYRGAGILKNSDRYCNIGGNRDIYGRYSVLLKFYEYLIDNAKLNENPNVEWYIINIPSGTVKNIKVDKFEMLGEIFEVMRTIIGELDGDLLYGDFLNKIYVRDNEKKKPDFDKSNALREKISEAFLTNNFRKFAKCFIPKNSYDIVLFNDAREILEKIIINWRWTKLGIPKEHLETIKKSGHVIAEVCRHNNLNLLYKLDKVRTSEEFWGVMREISRKMISLSDEDTKYINPMVLGNLISLVKEYEENWKELRDLLEIYSCMYISIKQHKRENNNENTE
ncbi:hypothetical protein [Methanothermococcus thermolithotrophicus]|jgi:hypothetical protein|uniref:hypothetical protein n=1 Tax=Methanothermococcus thermolithotrophicus TaxID=2186 RepID=UPI0003712C98|nr:hypothetical protein [Methanothermococcus thermolithotrophicus]